jgi:hypothetical protein
MFSMFFLINAMVVMFVAKGQGLMVVISPKMNAINIGKLLPSKIFCKKLHYNYFIK